mgnify:CR=1 FL=1
MDKTIASARQQLAQRVFDHVQQGKITTKKELDTQKRMLADGLNLAHLPTNPDLLPLLPGTLTPSQREMFSIKPIRNISGVAVLAAMVKPHTCPHGTCTYCPKGIYHPAPPAYTGDEPAAQRGYRNDFDGCCHLYSVPAIYTQHNPITFLLAIGGCVDRLIKYPGC